MILKVFVWTTPPKYSNGERVDAVKRYMGGYPTPSGGACTLQLSVVGLVFTFRQCFFLNFSTWFNSMWTILNYLFLYFTKNISRTLFAYMKTLWRVYITTRVPKLGVWGVTLPHPLYPFLFFRTQRQYYKKKPNPRKGEGGRILEEWFLIIYNIC